MGSGNDLLGSSTSANQLQTELREGTYNAREVSPSHCSNAWARVDFGNVTKQTARACLWPADADDARLR